VKSFLRVSSNKHQAASFKLQAVTRMDGQATKRTQLNDKLKTESEK
jgi:hypothetical protein